MIGTDRWMHNKFDRNGLDWRVTWGRKESSERKNERV